MKTYEETLDEVAGLHRKYCGSALSFHHHVGKLIDLKLETMDENKYKSAVDLVGRDITAKTGAEYGHETLRKDHKLYLGLNQGQIGVLVRHRAHVAYAYWLVSSPHKERILQDIVAGKITQFFVPGRKRSGRRRKTKDIDISGLNPSIDPVQLWQDGCFDSDALELLMVHIFSESPESELRRAIMIAEKKCKKTVMTNNTGCKEV